LLAGVVGLLTSGFQSSSALAGAYGRCCDTDDVHHNRHDLLRDSCGMENVLGFIGRCDRIFWTFGHSPVWGCIIVKFFDGGWFPILMALVLFPS
jgi:K+ transporter